MHKKQSGFSVVELMVTLLIAGSAFVLVASAYRMSARLADRSEDLLTANSIAYQKLQIYENKEFNDIPAVEAPANPDDPIAPILNFSSELPASLPGPKSGYVYITSQSSTLKYIFVRVTFAGPNGERHLEYGSLIQAGGLGR